MSTDSLIDELIDGLIDLNQRTDWLTGWLRIEKGIKQKPNKKGRRYETKTKYEGENGIKQNQKMKQKMV